MADLDYFFRVGDVIRPRKEKPEPYPQEWWEDNTQWRNFCEFVTFTVTATADWIDGMQVISIDPEIPWGPYTVVEANSYNFELVPKDKFEDIK